MSIPCGFTNSGLPIGLQLAAAPFEDRRLLALAKQYQSVTDWHLRRPAQQTAHE
jgi:aspartyl-tRNA(Asn)/glutamyl-tRNA(Gln) amidotransferase subunit A